MNGRLPRGMGGCSEDLWRAIGQRSRDGVLVIRVPEGSNTEPTCESCNAAALALLGWCGEPRGEVDLSRVAPALATREWVERYQEVVRSGRSAWFDHVFGESQATCRLRLERYGERLVVTLVDAKERLEREATGGAESALQLVVDHCPAMMSVHSPDGAYEYVNRTCRQLLGWDPEQLRGTSCYDYFHPEDLATIVQSHQSVNASPGETMTITYRLRRPDGSYRWVETSSRTIEDDGRIVCLTSAMSGVAGADERRFRATLRREQAPEVGSVWPH